MSDIFQSNTLFAQLTDREFMLERISDFLFKRPEFNRSASEVYVDPMSPPPQAVKRSMSRLDEGKLIHLLIKLLNINCYL